MRICANCREEYYPGDGGSNLCEMCAFREIMAEHQEMLAEQSTIKIFNDIDLKKGQWLKTLTVSSDLFESWIGSDGIRIGDPARRADIDWVRTMDHAKQGLIDRLQLEAFDMSASGLFGLTFSQVEEVRKTFLVATVQAIFSDTG